MTTPLRAIDVHSHYISTVHRRALAASTDRGDDGIVLPPWTLEETLAVMDDTGLQASVLSPISPAPVGWDAESARAVCRQTNVEMSSIVEARPHRFGAVAFMPMPHLDAVLDEIAFSLDDLGLDGVHLFTSYGGRYLGHPDFSPLLTELDRRAATVILHPTTPAGSAIVGMGWPAPTLEFVFDTTRTAGDLLFSGALERFANISWILPHGGGTLLQVVERLIRSVPILRRQPGDLFPDMPIDEDRTRELLQTLYFDVCWNTHSPVLDGLVEILGADHLLFGTDRPFPVPVAADLALLDGNTRLDDSAKAAIRSGNARRLFPALDARLAPHTTAATRSVGVR